MLKWKTAWKVYIINENCLLTLNQINEELRRRLPTIPRPFLKPWMGYLWAWNWQDQYQPSEIVGMSLKQGMNTRLVVHEGRRNQQLCAIDECGYNVWTSRSCGRARVGERAYIAKYPGNAEGMSRFTNKCQSGASYSPTWTHEQTALQWVSSWITATSTRRWANVLRIIMIMHLLIAML